MQAAILFKSWAFLEDHFTGDQDSNTWSAKARAEEEPASAVASGTDLKLVELSRDFPMFNDDSIPSFTMGNVLAYYRYRLTYTRKQMGTISALFRHSSVISYSRGDRWQEVVPARPQANSGQ